MLNKYKVYLFAFLFLAINILLIWFILSQQNSNYYRQLNGLLTKQERELLEAKETIGQLSSDINTYKELQEKFNNTTLAQNKELEKYIAKYNLQLETLTNLYANLNNQANTGNAGATPNGDKIAYHWEDTYKRFNLDVPNIYSKENIKFTYNQNFKLEVAGLVQNPKDGLLKVQVAKLYELDPKGNIITEARIDLDKSTFDFKPVIYGDTKSGIPINLGVSNDGFLALSVGLYRYKALELASGLGGDKNTQFAYLGVNYFPTLSFLESKVSVGANIGLDNNGKKKYFISLNIPIANIRKKAK